MDLTELASLRSAPVPPAAHVIDGVRRAASDGATMDVISPADGRILTTMPRGTVDDAASRNFCGPAGL
jgi:gamma-glutamyl-gamma-aminobutyraldehyde dehydrogenase